MSREWPCSECTADSLTVIDLTPHSVKPRLRLTVPTWFFLLESFLLLVLSLVPFLINPNNVVIVFRFLQNIKMIDLIVVCVLCGCCSGFFGIAVSLTGLLFAATANKQSHTQEILLFSFFAEPSCSQRRTGVCTT